MLSDIPLRFSHLKKLALSPAHYRHAVEHSDDFRQLRVGSATHALVFENELVCCYDGIRRGKEWEQFKLDHTGCILLNRAEYDDASAIAQAVKKNPLVQELGLLDGEGISETTLDWKYCGRVARSTPDRFTRHFVLDLKTTRCAKPDWFMREITKMAYHSQLAFYQDAIEHVHGYRPDAAYIVAVESKAPYPVVVFRLTPELLEAGHRQCRAWFEQLKIAEDSNCWTGYTDSIVVADVQPGWGFEFNNDADEAETPEAA